MIMIQMNTKSPLKPVTAWRLCSSWKAVYGVKLQFYIIKKIIDRFKYLHCLFGCCCCCCLGSLRKRTEMGWNKEKFCSQRYCTCMTNQTELALSYSPGWIVSRLQTDTHETDCGIFKKKAVPVPFYKVDTVLSCVHSLFVLWLGVVGGGGWMVLSLLFFFVFWYWPSFNFWKLHPSVVVNLYVKNTRLTLCHRYKVRLAHTFTQSGEALYCRPPHHTFIS